MDEINPSDIHKAGDLPKTLEIFASAEILLRSNVDVIKGLVNCEIGLITENLLMMHTNV